MTNTDKYKLLLNKLEQAIKHSLSQENTLEWLKSIVSGSSETLSTTVDIETIINPAIDLINRGGKRWRPLIMLLTMQALGKEPEDLHYLLSLSIELPHNGSLIIDDIEDKSETRRGEPSIHKLYGEDVAINTGCLLYFLPSFLWEEITLKRKLKNQLITSWFKVMRCLHIGQGLDIQWHNNPYYLPSREDYLSMCRWKTGSLPALSAYWGALLSDSNESLARKLFQIWESIGIGFQILDDVTNLTTGNKGKRRGDDLLEGKKSYPILVYANSENPLSILEDIKKLNQMKNENEQDIMIESIVNRLEKKGSLKESYAIGKNLLEDAKSRLSELLQPSEPLENLLKIIDSF